MSGMSTDSAILLLLAELRQRVAALEVENAGLWEALDAAPTLNPRPTAVRDPA